MSVDTIRSSLVTRDEARKFDRQLWEVLVNRNLISDLNDSGCGNAAFLRAVEKFSRQSSEALDLPFMISVGAQMIATEIVRRFGSGEQKDRYLADISSGRRIAAIGNAEVGSGTSLRNIRSEFVSAARSGTLNLSKTPATNAGQADLAICSVKHESVQGNPSIAVVIIEISSEDQRELTSTMAGFWTGLTGSICTTRSDVNFSDILLGDERSGSKILRFCYNLERLLLGAAVGGFLNGLTKLALVHVCNKQASGVTLHDKQFIQDKVLELHVSATKLDFLVQGSMNLLTDDLVGSLGSIQDPLGAIKLTIMDEGRRAVNAFHEIFGFSAFGLDHIAQKSVRDFMALQFLGGTVEQQKMLLFDHLVKAHGLTPHP